MKNPEASTALRGLSPARIFARPTAEDLWLGPTQESALSQLVLAAPLRALLGPLSSGRSTLLRQLGKPQEDCTVLTVAGPQRFRHTALKSLVRSAGLAVDDLDCREMRRILDVFLRERMGQRVLVIVDDADTFEQAAFAEIVRLVQDGAAAGWTPELVLSLVHIDKGSSPAADYLRAQSSPAVSVLSWMNDREVSWYLDWRLRRFGLSGLITPAATRLISRCTSGSFSAVDHLCQVALLLLRKHGGTHVDVTLVRAALIEMQRRRGTPGVRSAREPAGRLLISRDGDVVGRIALRDRLLIGRSELNDLSLDSDYLSRHHALILRAGTGYSITDLNSENGVLVNGEPVSTALINDGDVIRIGSFRIKIELDDTLSRAGALAANQVLAETAVMPTIDEGLAAQLRVVR